MSLVFLENEKTDAPARKSRGKLTAEEAAAVEQEPPARARHHDQADHRRRRRHRRDVDIFWRGDGDESGGGAELCFPSSKQMEESSPISFLPKQRVRKYERANGKYPDALKCGSLPSSV